MIIYKYDVRYDCFPLIIHTYILPLSIYCYTVCLFADHVRNHLLIVHKKLDKTIIRGIYTLMRYYSRICLKVLFVYQVAEITDRLTLSQSYFFLTKQTKVWYRYRMTNVSSSHLLVTIFTY